MSLKILFIWNDEFLLFQDRALVEGPVFEEFWKRDVEESVRQGNAKPFVEEVSLQVSDWGFSISDLKVQKQKRGKGILVWLKSVYDLAEEKVDGFLGPIYIWQVSELSSLYQLNFL